MKYVFWFCFALSGYVYLLYPLLVSLLARLAGRRYEKAGIEPPISIIITAYNEEQHMARKIENTLALDYPKDRMEIIVGSDGSTDRTNEIVESYKDRGVHLRAFPENRGKTMVQNDCVLAATHEIIVFMDAASLCKEDCLKRLVSNLADPRIGAVAGRVVFTGSGSPLGGTWAAACALLAAGACQACWPAQASKQARRWALSASAVQRCQAGWVGSAALLAWASGAASAPASTTPAAFRDGERGDGSMAEIEVKNRLQRLFYKRKQL